MHTFRRSGHDKNRFRNTRKETADTKSAPTGIHNERSTMLYVPGVKLYPDMDMFVHNIINNNINIIKITILHDIIIINKRPCARYKILFRMFVLICFHATKYPGTRSRKTAHLK